MHPQFDGIDIDHRIELWARWKKTTTSWTGWEKIASDTFNIQVEPPDDPPGGVEPND